MHSVWRNLFHGNTVASAVIAAAVVWSWKAGRLSMKYKHPDLKTIVMDREMFLSAGGSWSSTIMRRQRA